MNGGSTWLSVPGLSSTAALLLDSSDQIRFIPNGTISARCPKRLILMLGESDGAAGTIVDTTVDPLDNDVSEDGSIATLYVQPVVQISGPGVWLIRRMGRAVR